MVRKHEKNVIILGKLAKRLETAAENEPRVQWKRDLERDAAAVRWAIVKIAEHGTIRER